MPAGRANSLNIEQLCTCSSYTPCFKKANSLSSPKPNSTVPDCAVCVRVTAGPTAHSAVQGPRSSMDFNEDPLQSAKFNNLFLSFL